MSVNGQVTKKQNASSNGASSSSHLLKRKESIESDDIDSDVFIASKPVVAKIPPGKKQKTAANSKRKDLVKSNKMPVKITYIDKNKKKHKSKSIVIDRCRVNDGSSLIKPIFLNGGDRPNIDLAATDLQNDRQLDIGNRKLTNDTKSNLSDIRSSYSSNEENDKVNPLRLEKSVSSSLDAGSVYQASKMNEINGSGIQNEKMDDISSNSVLKNATIQINPIKQLNEDEECDLSLEISNDDSDYNKNDGCPPTKSCVLDNTIHSQYLGIQPSVKFKCYKCAENKFRTMLELQTHICQCNGIASSSKSNPNHSQNIKPHAEINHTNLRITRRVYLCSSCSTYYQNWDLYLHMREVHKKQICLYCLVMFSYSKDLWDHLYKVHKIESVTYDSEPELMSAFKDSVLLNCCDCNGMFSKGDHLDHKCELFIGSSSSFSKTGYSPGSLDNLKKNKLSSSSPAAKTHVSPEDEDYGMCDVSSFCRVAFDDMTKSMPESTTKDGSTSDRPVMSQLPEKVSPCKSSYKKDKKENSKEPNSTEDEFKLFKQLVEKRTHGEIEVQKVIKVTDESSNHKSNSNDATAVGIKEKDMRVVLKKIPISKRKLGKNVCKNNQADPAAAIVETEELDDSINNSSISATKSNLDVSVTPPPGDIISADIKQVINKQPLNKNKTTNSNKRRRLNAPNKSKVSVTSNLTKPNKSITDESLNDPELVIDTTVGKLEDDDESLKNDSLNTAKDKDDNSKIVKDIVIEKSEEDLKIGDEDSSTDDDSIKQDGLKVNDGPFNYDKLDGSGCDSPDLDKLMIDEFDHDYDTNKVADDSKVKNNLQMNDEQGVVTENVENDESKEMLAMALTLEDEVGALSLQTIIKECIRTACATCLYCNNAVSIAVNGKELALHLLENHKFKPTKSSTWDDVVTKLKNGLIELQRMYFNTDTYDSSNLSCHVTFNRMFACFQCEYVTNVLKELCYHKKKVHQKTIHLCIMCKCNFANYSELLCHLCPGVYSSQPCYLQFRCCFCGVGPIPSLFRLMVHLRKVHHVCDVCLEESEDQYKLYTHLGKHKLLQLCYKCNISYRTKNDMNKHLFWKHSTESVLCKKCLQKKWPYIYHFCTPSSIYTCEDCNAKFSKPVALTVHKRLHAGEYPFTCEKCDKKFISKKLMEKHEKIHAPPQLPPAIDNKSIDVQYETSLTSDVSNVENNLSQSQLNLSTSNEDDTSKLLDRKQHKKHKKQRKKKPLLDVYDLPPLNLSSESEDSDNEMKPQSGSPVNESKSESEDRTQFETNLKLGENLLDNEKLPTGTSNFSNDDNTMSGEVQSSQDSAQTVADNIWQNLNICKTDPEPIVYNFDYVALEHDYCLPEHIFKSSDKKDQPSAPSIGTEPSCNFDISPATTSNSADNLEQKRTPPPLNKSGYNSTPCKKKHNTPKKKPPVKSNDNASSSSSSSSSDSDSSSSCGSNCCCSGSSSSSSSSSDSECSSPEKKKSHREKKQKKKPKKIKMDTNSEVSNLNISIGGTVVSSQDDVVNESDLDTDFSLTDEEFYDKRPSVQQQEPPPNFFDNPVINSVISSDVSQNELSTVKRKRNFKNKRLNTKRKSQTVNHSPRTPSSLIKRPVPNVIYPYMPPVTNSSDLNSSFEHYSDVSSNSFTSAVRSRSNLSKSKENARQSARRRVRNKFYGYSSSDEGSSSAAANGTITPKVKKVGIKTILPQRIPTVPPVQAGIRVLPPVVKSISSTCIASTSKTFKSTPTVAGIGNLAAVQNEGEKRVNKLVINVNKGITSSKPVARSPGGFSSSTSVHGLPSPTQGSSSATSLNCSQGPPLSSSSSNPNPGASLAAMPGTSAQSVFNTQGKSEKTDHLYCYCQCPYDEVSEMIACDGPNCAIEWFHFECVGIMVPPKGKWFCPSCRKGSSTRYY